MPSANESRADRISWLDKQAKVTVRRPPPKPTLRASNKAHPAATGKQAAYSKAAKQANGHHRHHNRHHHQHQKAHERAYAAPAHLPIGNRKGRQMRARFTRHRPRQRPGQKET